MGSGASKKSRQEVANFKEETKRPEKTKEVTPAAQSKVERQVDAVTKTSVQKTPSSPSVPTSALVREKSAELEEFEEFYKVENDKYSMPYPWKSCT